MSICKEIDKIINKEKPKINTSIVSQYESGWDDFEELVNKGLMSRRGYRLRSLDDRGPCVEFNKSKADERLRP